MKNENLWYIFLVHIFEPLTSCVHHQWDYTSQTTSESVTKDNLLQTLQPVFGKVLYKRSNFLKSGSWTVSSNSDMYTQSSRIAENRSVVVDNISKQLFNLSWQRKLCHKRRRLNRTVLPSIQRYSSSKDVSAAAHCRLEAARVR